MRHKVLVIDDEWTTRISSYRKLEEESRGGGYELSLEFLERPNDLPNLVHSCQFSAYLVDVILDQTPGWENITLPDVIGCLGNDVPIILVSRAYDKAEPADVRAVWPKSNCKGFLQWREIEGEIGIPRVLLHLTKTIADFKDLELSPQLGSDEPLRLLHLSDMQFGGVDNSRLNLEAAACAVKIRAEWKTGPTFILITGDVSERGYVTEFEAARKWLQDLVKRFEGFALPSSRVMLVPGNHDVCLPLCGVPRVRLTDKELTFGAPEKAHDDLIQYSLRPYLDFCRSVSSTRLLDTPISTVTIPWVETRFQHLGIVFYGINTAFPPNSTTFPGREISADALASIADSVMPAIQLANATSLFIVGATHHAPVSGHADRSVTNPEAFETFVQNRLNTHLALHGHVHERRVEDRKLGNDWRMVLSAAPTLTKLSKARPEDTLRGFTMLEIRRLNGLATRIDSWHYEWISNSLLRREGPSYKRTKHGYFVEAA